MSARPRRDDHVTGSGETSPSPATSVPTRITVNIGPDTARALRTVMDHEGVTLTEAVRRLIGYGDLIFQAYKVENKDVLLRKDKEVQQIILI